MKYRYEIKIPVSQYNENIFNTWIHNLPNTHEKYEKRQINNIYYDNENYSSAKDNLDGIFYKTKYRIRWYYNKNQSKCFIELKIKKGRLGNKIIIPTDKILNEINLKEAFNINSKEIDIKKNNILLEYLSDKFLFPVLKVKYQRSYFVFENKIRLTFDKNVQFSNFEGVDKDNWINDKLNVLEIKFDPDNLNFARNLISKIPFVPKRHSKYLRGLSLCGKAFYI